MTVPTGGWTLSINDSGAGAAVTATLAAGTYYWSTADTIGGGTASLLSAISTSLNLAATTDTITVTLSAGESGTGKLTITSSGSTTIAWVSTDWRDLMGFASDLAAGTTWTSPSQVRNLWLPDCFYNAPNAVDDAFRGWRESDLRENENAAGYGWAHMGQEKVVNAISWHAVSRSRIWQANESTTNASWERFCRDGIWGVAGWGTPGGPLRFHPDADSNALYATYRPFQLQNIQPSPAMDGWAAGPWVVSLPRLVQVPGTESIGLGWGLAASAAEFASIFPGIPVPTSIWPMQDAALPLVDTVAALNLNTGNASGAELMQQSNETLAGRYSMAFDGIASHVRGTATTVLDLTTGNFAVFWRFKVNATETPAGGHFFVRKKSSSAGTNGWAVKFNGSNGYLEAILDSSSSTEVSALISVNHDDGAWHYAMAVVNRTAATLELYSDLGSASVSIAAHAGASLTNATYFGLGDTNGNFNAAVIADYSYMAAWNGGTMPTAANFATLRNA